MDAAVPQTCRHRDQGAQAALQWALFAILPKEAESVDSISDLPMPDDMDTDYSPQYVKLARVLRDKIESGKLSPAEVLPAGSIASRYGVSTRVAYAALEMLAANRYIGRLKMGKSYRVS
jgi:hypothetical protein